MVDYELLSAISDLLDRKLEEKLEPVNERLDCIDERLDRMDERLDHMDDRLDHMHVRLDHMDERLGSLEFTVNRNYNVMLDFYGFQREFNTQIVEYMQLSHSGFSNYAQFSS